MIEDFLIACEYTGAVRDALILKGQHAISCDLIPSESPNGGHYTGDVMEILYSNWYGLIAFPPCTYICNSGVRWLWNKDGTKNKERWALMEQGALFFKALWEAPISHIAIENPIMHKYAKEIIFGNTGKNYTQIIQPWQFGHTEKKATCLFLKGFPPLKGTKNVKEEMSKLPVREQQRVHHMSPGPSRGMERSRTYAGVAEAIADQWTRQ
jgi:hypothetical protein